MRKCAELLRLSARFAALVVVVGCASESEPRSTDEGSSQTTAAEQLLARRTPEQEHERWPARPCGGTHGSIEGAWRSRGYGLALRATASEFVLYQVSESTCFEDYRGPLDGLCDPTLRVDIGAQEQPASLLFQSRVRGDVLTVRNATIEYSFDRTRTLPPACAAGATAQSQDPELSFETLWQHFDEHYAFFALHDVDWAAQYRKYRPQVTATTTPDALFEIMASMLEPLRDYHVQLTSEERSYVRPPPADILAYNADIAAYLRAHYRTAPGVVMTGNGLIAYRELEDGLGYVSVGAMAGFADAAAVAAGEDAFRSDVEGAAAAIDEAIAALAHTRGLIVDVRFNGGGLDGVALAIASRFADEKRLAYRKFARDGDGVTAPRAFFVQPDGEHRYTRDVALLTSAVTLSAAEIFVLAMRVLPNVTVIGDATAGSHSDVLERTLPNGWEVGLSSETYVTPAGHVYEGVGIPPDVRVPLDAAAFGQQRDVIFETARAHLLQR